MAASRNCAFSQAKRGANEPTLTCRVRWLMPAAALAGGTLLTVADTIARTLIAPAQLPVGVLTALVGVPLFLWLLRRSDR